MRIVKVLLIVCVVVMLVACGSSSRRADRATADSAKKQSKIAEERLKLVEDYKKCVDKAGDDKDKVEACDTYLKAAESLK